MDRAFVVEPEPVVTVKPVGLKLDVSPEILPRDTSIGTKIFTLVPNEARNVREVKSYLANYVLKTPSPFHVFVGEYRILDEEDVQIFSLISEPCRLLPVPKPRPALSSTPKVKHASVNGSSGSSKRVTFFDGDLSASPVARCEGLRSNRPSMDVLDHVPTSRQIHATPVIPTTSSSNGSSDTMNLQDNESAEAGGSEERKKRRRRRHRTKKSKSGSGSEPEFDNEGEGVEVKSEQPGNIHSASASNRNSTATSKESLDVLNEDTESEEETLSGEISKESDDQFNFVTPRSVPVANKRQNKTENSQTVHKKQKLSDSAFCSPGSFLSPVPSGDLSSSGKVRQDTPIPRVIRNPKVFDAARKIINDFGAVEQEDDSKEMMQDDSTESISSLSIDSKNSEENGMSKNGKRDFYNSLDLIQKLDDLNNQDKIAFRVLELDERYNPCISNFKEGIVVGKAGGALTIQYTKNDAVPTNGKFEFSFCENEDEDSHSVVLHFAELIEPKLISRPVPV